MLRFRSIVRIGFLALLLNILPFFALAQDTLTITDHVGKTVEIKLPIERVVTTFRPITYFVYAIGGQQKLVGVDSNSVSCPLLYKVYPPIKELPQVGSKNTGYNIETIIKAKPDVVILHSGDGMDVIAKQLASQGIPAVTVIPETLELMQDTALILGKVFGREEQVDSLLKFHADTLNLIQDRIKDIPLDQRKRVYMTGSSLFVTCGKDLFQHHLIEMAGGRNVSEDLNGYFPQISPEQLVAWNPDVIFSIYHFFDGSVESILAHEQLQSLKAIKEQQVYKIPSFLGGWDYPEPRSALGALFIAKTLYPERFQDIDMLKIANQFHTRYYGKSYEFLGGTQDEADGKAYPDEAKTSGDSCPMKQHNN